ncbi:hypothetical protein K8S17_01215 [bacterium]|nr:hypothetical protein [bacterium]
MRRSNTTNVRSHTHTRSRTFARSYPNGVRTAAAMLAVLLTTTFVGCGENTDGEPRMRPADNTYVEYMAALTLAIDEGLCGEDAAVRILELGSEPLTRDELDAHVERLSRDPVKWSRLEENVENRVEDLSREVRASDRTPQSGRPHQSPE